MENYNAIILSVASLCLMSICIISLVILWQKIANLFNISNIFGGLFDGIFNIFSGGGDIPNIFNGGDHTVVIPASTMKKCFESQNNVKECCSPGGVFYNFLSNIKNSFFPSVPEDKKQCVCTAIMCWQESLRNKQPSFCNNYLPLSDKSCDYHIPLSH